MNETLQGSAQRDAERADIERSALNQGVSDTRMFFK